MRLNEWRIGAVHYFLDGLASFEDCFQTIPLEIVLIVFRFGNTDELVKMDIRRMLLDGFRSNRTALLLNEISLDEKDLPITKLTEVLARSTAEKRGVSLNESPTDKGLVQTESLPRVITFPYSRHSSYEELCHLVKVFNPKDVYPCTVDEENWDEGTFLLSTHSLRSSFAFCPFHVPLQSRTQLERFVPCPLIPWKLMCQFE